MPRGSETTKFENLEGLVLVPARLHGGGGRDTSGSLVLDTGAGYLGLDHPLAEWLGVVDSASIREAIGFTEVPLRRLELGKLQIDQVRPILVFDADVIHKVSGRRVLGLLGQRVFTGRIIWIDYTRQLLASVATPPSSGPGSRGDRNLDEAAGEATSAEPRADRSGTRDRDATKSPSRSTVDASRRAFGSLMSSGARAVPFRLAGDNKMLVRLRVIGRGRKASEWLTLVFDTGATKTVLFEPAFTARVPESKAWRSLSGIVAPTLIGSDPARLTIAPSLELEGVDVKHNVRRADIDCALLESELATTIEAATGEPIHGLLGYSFFKRYRIGMDFTRGLLWLDPDPGFRETRAYEYSQVGIQLEGDAAAVRVLGVAERSPAALAGIEAGDQLVSVDGHRADPAEIVAITRRLEGPPGTVVRLVVRKNGAERTYRLVRRRLLQ